jgi:hypothetical protein
MVDRLATALGKLLMGRLGEKPKLSYRQFDVSVKAVGADTSSYVIALGPQAAAQAPSDSTVWVLPVASKLENNKHNTDHRQAAYAVLQKAANTIVSGALNKPQETVKTYVETKDGVSIGQEDADINITPSELKHLKHLRDLVKEAEIVIEKDGKKVKIP